MDSQLVQRSRYVLRARVRRVQTCPPLLFLSACRHLLGWLDHHALFGPLLAALDGVAVNEKRRIEQTFANAPNAMRSGYDPGRYQAADELEHAAVCLHILRAVGTLDDSLSYARFLLACCDEYLTDKSHWSPADDVLEPLRDVAIDGLYEYLDEQIDARNMLLAVLNKYKQRSEWFHRSRLREFAAAGLEGKTGERALALDLQEYILDQGVEFFVEPSSASGEADLVLRDSDGRYIIIDAKYVRETDDPSAIKKKVAGGVHQVARYCQDFNEPDGFLIVFVEAHVRLRPQLQESEGCRFATVGGKTIYYIEVHISDEPPASKSGIAREVEIPSTEIVGPVAAS